MFEKVVTIVTNAEPEGEDTERGVAELPRHHDVERERRDLRAHVRDRAEAGVRQDPVGARNAGRRLRRCCPAGSLTAARQPGPGTPRTPPGSARGRRRAFSRIAGSSSARCLEAQDRVGRALGVCSAKKTPGLAVDDAVANAADAVGDHRHAGRLRLDGDDPEVLLAGEQERPRAREQAPIRRRPARARGTRPGRRRRAQAASSRPVPATLTGGRAARRPRPPGRRACTARAARRRGSRSAGVRGVPSSASTSTGGWMTCGVAAVVVRDPARRRGASWRRRRPAARAGRGRCGAAAASARGAARPTRPSPRSRNAAPRRGASAYGSSRRAASCRSSARSWRTNGSDETTRSKPSGRTTRTRCSSAAAAAGSCGRARDAVEERRVHRAVASRSRHGSGS